MKSAIFFWATLIEFFELHKPGFQEQESSLHQEHKYRRDHRPNMIKTFLPHSGVLLDHQPELIKIFLRNRGSSDARPKSQELRWLQMPNSIGLATPAPLLEEMSL